MVNVTGMVQLRIKYIVLIKENEFTIHFLLSHIRFCQYIYHF